MNEYRSEAKYKWKHPKTGEVEETSRFHKGWYSNVAACEAQLMKHIKLDEPIGKIKMVTRRVK